MAQITYDDKSNSLPTSNPRRLFTAIDANEVKNVVNTNDTDTSAALALRELLANKAVDFSTLNNTLYPTIQAVENRILAAIVGLSWKTPAAVATTANITLSGEQTIDGVLTSASRVLVKDQSTASQNGIYVTGAGAWTRATDMDVSAEFNGAAVTVLAGTANANTTWIQTSDNVTVGSTSIVWAQLGTSVPDASETVKGIIEIATQAETNTGTDDVKAVTPLKLANATPVTNKQLLVNSPVALTDAASMDLTAIKHTLTTSSDTRTFTISYTGDDITIEVTLNATSSTFTFPATSLCVSDGLASGDNTCPLAGVSGDKYIIAIKKIGSDYYVVSKNFGQ